MEMGTGKTIAAMTGKSEAQLKFAELHKIPVVNVEKDGKLNFKPSKLNHERNQCFGAWYATIHPLKFALNYWFSDRKWYLGAYNLVHDNYITVFYVEIPTKNALELIRGK